MDLLGKDFHTVNGQNLAKFNINMKKLLLME